MSKCSSSLQRSPAVSRILQFQRDENCYEYDCEYDHPKVSDPFSVLEPTGYSCCVSQSSVPNLSGVTSPDVTMSPQLGSGLDERTVLRVIVEMGENQNIYSQVNMEVLNHVSCGSMEE